MRDNLIAYIKDNDINLSALARAIGYDHRFLWDVLYDKNSMPKKMARALRLALADAPLKVRQELREGGVQCKPTGKSYQQRGGEIDHWHKREGKTELAWGPKNLCELEE